MHGGSMKDKIISFILILLTVAILGAIVLFGYVAYVEITGNDITSIDFVGYGDILGIGKDKKEEERIVFVKSWNEWGEGNYLEPDLQYGDGHLTAFRSVIESLKY